MHGQLHRLVGSAIHSPLWQTPEALQQVLHAALPVWRRAATVGTRNQNIARLFQRTLIRQEHYRHRARITGTVHAADHGQITC